MAVDRRELVRIHFVMPWDQYSLKFFAMPFGSRPLPINPGSWFFCQPNPGGRWFRPSPPMHTSRLLVSAACGSGLAALSAPSRPKSLAAPAVTAVCCPPGFKGIFLLNPKNGLRMPQGVFFRKWWGNHGPVRDHCRLFACRLLKWVVYISFDMFFDSSAIFSDALDINGLYAPRKSKLTVPTWKHRTSQNPLYSHHADRPASNVFKLLGVVGLLFHMLGRGFFS